MSQSSAEPPMHQSVSVADQMNGTANGSMSASRPDSATKTGMLNGTATAPAAQTTAAAETITLSASPPAAVEAAAALHGEMFKTDPVLTYIMRHHPPEKRERQIHYMIETLLRAAAQNGARFDETRMTNSDSKSDPVSPPTCSAVWIPPGGTVADWRTYMAPSTLLFFATLGPRSMARIFLEFEPQTGGAKKRHLRHVDGKPVTRFAYLFWVSTAIEQRGRGVADRLIRCYQRECAEKDVPIWLEATTEKSRRLYLRLGFVDAESWVVGKGKAGPDGLTAKGGAGVRLFAMIWWPPKGESKK